MVKGIIVTFEYDTETDLVSNVVCSVDGVEKKKRTTKPKAKIEEEMATVPLITREEAKLVFNNKAVADMEIEYKDRILIKWEQIGKSKKFFPTIGKDIAFGEENSGNQVTKTNTVAYKGKQNVLLAELGTQFTIEPYKDEIWKLVPTTNMTTVADTLEDAIKSVETIEPDIITQDEEVEITKLPFTF